MPARAAVIEVIITEFLLSISAGIADGSDGWRKIFAKCAILCTVASTPFVMFAPGDRLFGSDS